MDKKEGRKTLWWVGENFLQEIDETFSVELGFNSRNGLRVKLQ